MKGVLLFLSIFIVYHQLIDAKPKPVNEDPTEVEHELAKELQALETVANPMKEEPKASVNLKELFDRIFVLIDTKKLQEFLVKKLTTDPEAQNVFRYLKGEKAESIVCHLTREPEYNKLMQWFYENGMTQVYEDLKKIYSFFGWDVLGHSTTEVVVDSAFAQSLQSLLEELMEVLPMNAIASLAMELYQVGDPAAVALLQRFREPGMIEAWHRFKTVPAVQELGHALVEGGVALEIFVVIIEAFFGWA